MASRDFLNHREIMENSESASILPFTPGDIMSGPRCFCVPAMDQDQSSTVPDAGRFDSTRWTVVLEAAQSRAPGGPEALARLCARYWQPLYGNPCWPNLALS